MSDRAKNLLDMANRYREHAQGLEEAARLARRRAQELRLEAELEALDVPTSAGRPACAAALLKAGARFDTNVLARVVRLRRSSLTSG